MCGSFQAWWSWWPVAAVPAAVWAYLRYFEWKQLFKPSRLIEATPAAVGLEFEDVAFVSEDDTQLHGWWIPCERARGAVIYCPGNSGNVSQRIGLAADYQRLGLNALLFDYRGYGRSLGLPTEKGTYRDARAAYEVVRARYGDVENPPVVVHGQSLGGAVAIQLSLDKPVRGLMVESTFTRILDMGRWLYPWLPVKWFSRYHYDSQAKVPRLQIPKLFAHSREDDRVPYEFGRRLFESASEPKAFVELSGGHDEAGWGNSPDYWKAVEQFLDRVLGPVQKGSIVAPIYPGNVSSRTGHKAGNKEKPASFYE